MSVTLPVSQANDWMKRVLFRPFDLGKWFVIGFAAWLAELGEGGAHFNVPTGFRNNGTGFRHGFDQARDFVMSNLHWIIPLAVALVIVGLALWILFTWLSSRGRFMLLHCVAFDQAEIGGPWTRYARQARSLFWFRIVVGLIAVLPMLPLAILGVVEFFAMMGQGHPSAAAVFWLVAIVLLLICIGFALQLLWTLTTDFVVPIMFIRGNTCRAAWSELIALMTANAGQFLLYVLFRILLAIAIGTIVFVLVVVTCCIAGCVMAIPYVGTVLLMPVLVFRRAYPLFYLAQYGANFNAFQRATAPAQTPH